MQINPRFIRRYQEGGGMEPPMDEGAAPAGGAPELGGQDPIQILALMSAQAVQNQDCNMAMQVCQAFLQIIQQMQSEQGGGGAPAEQGEPVYAKRGAKLIRRIRR